MTKESSNPIYKITWLAFQAIAAFCVTFFTFSILSIAVILVVGVVGLVLVALGSLITFLHAPYFGTFMLIAGVFLFIIVAIIGLVILTLMFAFAISFVSLLISLLVDAIFRHDGIKSWLLHLLAYAFSGALAGIPFGLLGLAAVWGMGQMFQQLQSYSLPAMIVVMALSILAGIFSVNVSGITMGALTKVRDSFLKPRSA